MPTAGMLGYQNSKRFKQGFLPCLKPRLRVKNAMRNSGRLRLPFVHFYTYSSLQLGKGQKEIMNHRWTQMNFDFIQLNCAV
jgi:hypothetical protein